MKPMKNNEFIYDFLKRSRGTDVMLLLWCYIVNNFIVKLNSKDNC